MYWGVYQGDADGVAWHGACHASRPPLAYLDSVDLTTSLQSSRLTCLDTNRLRGPHEPLPAGSQEVRGFESHRLHPRSRK
jgi:hypothetical protein